MLLAGNRLAASVFVFRDVAEKVQPVACLLAVAILRRRFWSASSSAKARSPASIRSSSGAPRRRRRRWTGPFRQPGSARISRGLMIGSRAREARMADCGVHCARPLRLTKASAFRPERAGPAPRRTELARQPPRRRSSSPACAGQSRRPPRGRRHALRRLSDRGEARRRRASARTPASLDEAKSGPAKSSRAGLSRRTATTRTRPVIPAARTPGHPRHFPRTTARLPSAGWGG